MSGICIYIWIDGNDFDPKKFNDSLGSNLRGEICIRKNISNSELIKSQPVSFWKSKKIEVVDEFPEEALIALLKQYEAAIYSVHKHKETRIMAELVVKYEKPEDVRGYYFSPESIGYLSQLKIGVDIDVYLEDE